MSTEIPIDDGLVAKFLTGEAAPDEAMALTDWIEASPENQLHFERSALALALPEVASFGSAVKEEIWRAITEQKQHSATPTGRVPFFTPLRLAAAIALTAAATVFILTKKPNPPPETWVTKSVGEETVTVPLSEGTSVVLNKNSTITYPRKFGEKTRTVRLAGEAFFDVVHDAERPFVIDNDEVSIKVLGTAFNVSNIKSQPTIETKVIRGKVMMYHNQNSIVIDAGWTGTYERASKKFSLSKTVSENNLGYATHSLSFDDTSLEQVTRNLAESYGVQFIFENDKLKECHLTSSYQNKPLVFILDVIAESLNIQYAIKGNIVYISGDGCL